VLIFDRFKTRTDTGERPAVHGADIEPADIEPEIERLVEDFAGNLRRHVTTMSWGGTGLGVSVAARGAIGAKTHGLRGLWLGLRGLPYRRRR
jgi:hypothetical protein